MRRIAEHAAPRSLRGPNQPLARVIGADTVVPCADGRARRLREPRLRGQHSRDGRRVGCRRGFVPWYSSVHRGSGLKSRVSTAAFEDARDAVAEFVGARADDAVVFVRNTTEAINVLSAALPAGRACSRARSSITPTCFPGAATISGCSGSPARQTSCWMRVSARCGPRGRGSTWSPSPAPRTSAGRCGRSPSWPSLPTLTGRSCSSTRRSSHPSVASTWRGAGIDFLALSGHKLYAPFGAGALVGDGRRLGEGEPLLHGGGAIELVTLGRRHLGGRPRPP